MKFDLEIAVTQTGSGFSATVSGVANVEHAVNRAGASIKNLGEHKNPFEFFTHGSEEFLGSMLKTVSIVALAEKAIEGLREGVEWTKEAIGHADFVRDLNLSLTAYVGNVEQATAVIAYFNAEQIHTRNTAEELQQTFRNLNPLANTKGFTIAAQEQITVMLSQVATVANKSFDEIEAGYRRVLSGVTGGASRNPLLQVLGISGHQLANMGWDEFLAKIQTASEKAGEFGQTWESTAHKAKDALMNAFAEGFNEAHGSAVEGMDAITALVRDPQITDALKEMGHLTAELAGNMGGVVTELRGVLQVLNEIHATDFVRILWTVSPGGDLTAVIRGVGAVGNEHAAAATANATQATAIESGHGVMQGIGLAYVDPTGSPRDRVTQLNRFLGAQTTNESIIAGKDLQSMEEALGHAITGFTKAQIDAFEQELAADAKDHKVIDLDDVTQAKLSALAMGNRVDGAPHGRIGGPAAENGGAQAVARTEQLLAQAKVIDLQNQKLAVQSELDKEAQILGEKKFGLQAIQLDQITEQILAQHEINALHVIAIDQQIEETKALSDYRTTLAEIDKKQKADAAKQGGATVSDATFDAERSAARTKFNAQTDEIAGKRTKALADEKLSQQKLTDEAKLTVLARADELVKIEAMVAAQKDENTVLAANVLKSQQQAQIAQIEVALQYQRITFGSTGLDQQTDALLKLHETLTLQQTANDTEIAMQEERKRYAKEQVDLAKEMRAVITTGYAGEGVNPAINALTLLGARERAGDELHIQQIQTDGHTKTMADIKAESDLRNAAIDKATQGYIGMANVIASSTHDIFAGILEGQDLQHMLSGLVAGYKSLLTDVLDATTKKYLTAWQQMAQGHIDPLTGQMGHVDPSTGQMVPTTVAQQQRAQNYMTAAQGTMALYSSYQNAQAGASKGANAASGAVAGATLFAPAGPYGMAVGAIIGAAYGAVFSAIAEGSKARFQLNVGNDGRISVTGFGKATAGNVDSAMHTINETITQATGAMRGLIDAFPIAIGQQLSGLGNLPAGVLGTDVERVRTFAISIWKKSFAGGYTADQLQHFMSEDLPKILLDAALPMMNTGLQNLGVNAAKIASLTDTAHDDPSKAFQFMTDYVAGFVAMRDSIDFLGKTSGQKTAVAMDLANPHLVDQLAKANERIAYLGQGFDQLANVDQVARLGQINAAIAQRYQLEIQALNDIANAKKAVATSYNDTRRGFAAVDATPEQQIALLQNQRALVAAGLYDQINHHSRELVKGAQTPAEVTAIADSYLQLTTQIFNAAKSLRDSFQSVLDSFKSLDDQKAADIIAALGPSAQLSAITAKATGISSTFSSLSDADKIANSHTLLQLATQYYNVQKQALTDLGNEATSLHERVSQQIFGIKYDQLKADPQAQIEMLMEQQRALYASLSSATTAQQVDAIMQQIQGNVTTISGLEGNTPQAAADAIKALTEAEKAAQAQITLLTAQAKANDDAIAAAIKGVTDNVTSTISALDTLMTQASADLIAFQKLIQAKLDTFVDAMKTSDADLLLTLQPIFTALGASTVTVNNDLIDISKPGGGLDQFRGGLNSVIDVLGQFATLPIFGRGTATGFSSAAFSSSTSMPTPVFMPTINVDISGNMAPFVTLIRTVVSEEMNMRQMQQARFARTGAPL